MYVAVLAAVVAAVYESVRSFCLQRPVVGYMDLLANFYELSEDQLGKVLDGLMREGLIEVRKITLQGAPS